VGQIGPPIFFNHTTQIMSENIFLDGLGSFNHSTVNAGTIKWGEFNNAAINTGSIVLSAVFTGTSVNSGSIGDLMPVYTVALFQANSGYWESAYSTVLANSASWGAGGGNGGSYDWSTITNIPATFEPSSHTHAVSEVVGLQPIVTWVSQNSGSANNVLGNSAYTLIANNSATWSNGGDWSNITNKPTEFTPSSHFHHASSINTGVLDPARIPVINTSIQVISQGGLADLTVSQQDEITKGALVTTTDGQRYVYTTGSKTNSSSYILLADVTPEWSVIANKPVTFAPTSHTHTVSEVTGLDVFTTWVSQNSGSANNALGNSAYSLITSNSATWSGDAVSPAIVNYIFDNGTSPVSINAKGNVTLPAGFVPTEWQVITDVETTASITLNKASYENYPTMTTLGSVSITNARKNSNSNPQFANLSANDILEFIVSSNSAATKITVSLKGNKI
jgi:hypothetical protein